MTIGFESGTSRWVRVMAAGGLALALAWLPATAISQSRIEPEADRVLKSMSSYLGGLAAFTFDADVDEEYVFRSGEKLQFSAFVSIAVKRPGNVHASRHGGFADLDMTFDGKTFTIHGKRANAYAQIDTPGTIEQMIDSVREQTGFHFAGADLLYSNAAEGLLIDVESGAYWGTTFVNGVECHYLAFRARDVDWQIWIQAGYKPLPMKYVITSKLHLGAPQYSVRLRNWNTSPQLDAKQFSFAPPSGARKLESIPVSALGEMTFEEKK